MRLTMARHSFRPRHRQDAHVDLRASYLSLYLLLPEYHPKDTDRSGTIGFNEFAGLWKYIKDWQNVYRHFDRDRSGSIDTNELNEALQQFGYNLSPQLLRLVEAKYGESILSSYCAPYLCPYPTTCPPILGLVSSPTPPSASFFSLRFRTRD